MAKRKSRDQRELFEQCGALVASPALRGLATGNMHHQQCGNALKFGWQQ